MPKGKPYSGSIDAKTAVQLLNSSGESVDGAMLGDALAATAARLADLVRRSNQFLKTNEFARLVADYHAMKLGRRGHVDLMVTAVGQMLLEIGYDDVPARPLVKQTRRKLPLLKDLRAEAEALGVSISSFGIKRKEIMDFLDQVRADRRGKESRRPPVVEEDRGPMSAGPDETKVSPAEELRPPKRQGFVKTQSVEVSEVLIDERADPPAAASRRSLRQIVEQSKEVNIADLLDSAPPK